MKVKIKHFNDELPEYLTLGKHYDVTLFDNCNGGRIVNDFGDESSINFACSAHLNEGSWEIVSEHTD